MKVVKVKPSSNNVKVKCLKCGEFVFTNDAFADLDGQAFGAYYHLECLGHSTYPIMDDVVDFGNEWQIFVKEIGNIYVHKDDAPEQLDIQFYYIYWNGSGYSFSARGD